MMPVMVFRTLELARRRNAGDDAETPSSVFLPVDVFVVFPRRGRGDGVDEENRPPTATILLFFSRSLERGIVRGQRRKEEKKRRPGRRLFSTFLRLHFSSLLLLHLRLLSLSLSLSTSSLRDLIRCKKSGNAEEMQFTQLARQGYLIIC